MRCKRDRHTPYTKCYVREGETRRERADEDVPVPNRDATHTPRQFPCDRAMISNTHVRSMINAEAHAAEKYAKVYGPLHQSLDITS